MRKLYLFDIEVYILSAFLIIIPLVLILHVPQWAIDAVALGIILASINNLNRRTKALSENTITIEYPQSEEKQTSDENEWAKGVKVFKQIEDICKENGFTIIIPIQRGNNNKQGGTEE